MSIQSKLGRFDLTMIIISLVIGIGIFKTPGIVAEKAGSPFIFYAAWIIGGIISVFGALTFAEIGARLPVAGGFYKIFSHCYHPAFAFMLNWASVIINAGSAVGVALVGAEYIQPVLSGSGINLSHKNIALFVISLLFVFNYLGIKMGARVQNILSSLKIIMILVFCMAVFFGESAATVSTPVSSAETSVFMALVLSLIPIFFTFGGYQNTVNFGADVKDAQRNIPLAITTGIAIILGLYLMINIAYCQLLGFENLRGMDLPAAELAQRFFGEAGFKITSVVIFTSVLGFVNTSLMSNPRVYYAMADDKILPPVFKKVNERTQTQEFALGFFFALMLISLFILEDFKRILDYVVFIDCLALAFAAATIFVFRKRMKDVVYAGFKVKFFPVIPIVFIVVLFMASASVFLSDWRAAAIGLGIFAAGFPLYHLIKKLMKDVPDK